MEKNVYEESENGAYVEKYVGMVWYVGAVR